MRDGDINDGTVQSELAGKNRNENPGVYGVEEHLEQRIKGHQASSILCVTLGQFVPDNDHRNTAGETDHDESGHVFGVCAEEHYGQNEHQNRAYDPVLHE